MAPGFGWSKMTEVIAIAAFFAASLVLVAATPGWSRTRQLVEQQRARAQQAFPRGIRRK